MSELGETQPDAAGDTPSGEHMEDAPPREEEPSGDSVSRSKSSITFESTFGIVEDESAMWDTGMCAARMDQLITENFLGKCNGKLGTMSDASTATPSSAGSEAGESEEALMWKAASENGFSTKGTKEGYAWANALKREKG